MHFYSFTGLTASYSADTIFQNLHIKLKQNEVICLTGPNGSGKTSLLNLIRSCCKNKNIPVELLRQEYFYKKGESPGQSRTFELFKLFRSKSPFSVLLLDEPTNHLDSNGFNLFLKELINLNTCMLIVSHDRRMLRAAGRILHLEGGKLENYGNGYDEYIFQREQMKLAEEQRINTLDHKHKKNKIKLNRTINRQQKRQNRAEKITENQKIPKAMVNSQRNRAEKTEAKLQKIHNHRLDKIKESSDEVKKNRHGSGIKFHLPITPENNIKTMFRLYEVNHALPDGFLWSNNINLLVNGPRTVGITGRNGSGKSTLLNILSRNIIPSAGESFLQTKRPYLIEQMRYTSSADDSLLKIIEMRFRDILNENFRTYLSYAGFRNEDVYKRYRHLSGGEKIRFHLLLASMSNPDALFLDEPTNDLDSGARDFLAEYIRTIGITVFIVSHDLEFLNECKVDEILDMDHPGTLK